MYQSCPISRHIHVISKALFYQTNQVKEASEFDCTNCSSFDIEFGDDWQPPEWKTLALCVRVWSVVRAIVDRPAPRNCWIDCRTPVLCVLCCCGHHALLSFVPVGCRAQTLTEKNMPETSLAAREGLEDIVQLQTMYVQVEQRPIVNSQPAGTKSAVVGGRPHSPGTNTSSGRYVVTVKLECPDSQVITQAWTLAASAGSLKERLARMVDLPVATLHLLHGGRQIQDHVTLGELGGRVNETISLSLRSTDPVAFPIRIKSCRPEDLMPLPDVITVRIRQRNGPCRDLVVEIENQSVRPPFLGGWRKKSDGLCFYHAQTQTDYTVGPDDRPRLLSTGPKTKDCQVATIGDNHTQTSSSVSCQVGRVDWNMSRDGNINPGRFVSLDDALKSAIIIQRRVKRWIAKKRMDPPRPPSVTSSSESISNKPTIEPVEALIIRFGDVTIEKNRCEERIDSHRVIFHEIEMLNSTKSSAVKDRILRRLLHRISQPKVWKSSTGAVVEVDTVEIEHLREMRLMYEAVCNSTLTEDRVRALHLLKRTLWKKSGPLVKELLQLADRELDLLARGLMSSALSGLQSRLRALLRHFITEQLPQPPLV